MGTSWEHLLGGYATNTLTDEEKRQLFEAALNDQTLFDALADEEALKAMLADPEARRRILASLEATERSGGVSDEKVKWVSWFRQHTSLAWAGSIAAVGLALIFGWQMEKEWGSMVSQEQQPAKSSSREELAFRTQKPSDESTLSVRKRAFERTPAQTEGIEGRRQLTPEPASRVDPNAVERPKPFPAMAEKESDAREKGQAMSRQRANEQVAQALSSSSPSNQPKVEPSVRALAVPEAPEVPMPDMAPQATAPGRFANQAVEEAPLAPPSAQELFYAASGFLADEVIAEINDNGRVDQGSKQALGGAVSKERTPPSKKNKALSFPLEREVAGGSAIPTAQGIRYSFVLHTKKGKDEEVENRKIAGNWSELRLAVESNVSGYLYVLASLENGRWQKLVPTESDKTGQVEEAIKVKSFQRVEFALGQLKDNSNKPVVPSLTVLLSPTLLDDLGQWLGSEVDMTGLLIEREAGAVFAIDPEPEKKFPLRVVISLLKF